MTDVGEPAATAANPYRNGARAMAHAVDRGTPELIKREASTIATGVQAIKARATHVRKLACEASPSKTCRPASAVMNINAAATRRELTRW
jgi:hypothetical protein